MMYMYIVHKGHDETLILYVHIQLYISVQRGESVRPGVYIVYQQWLVCVCVCVCVCVRGWLMLIPPCGGPGNIVDRRIGRH